MFWFTCVAERDNKAIDIFNQILNYAENIAALNL